MSLLFDKNKKYIYNSTIKSVFDKVCMHYPNNTFLSSAYTGQNKLVRTYTYEEVKTIISKEIFFNLFEGKIKILRDSLFLK